MLDVVSTRKKEKAVKEHGEFWACVCVQGESFKNK